jgi:hypothetical protein
MRLPWKTWKSWKREPKLQLHGRPKEQHQWFRDDQAKTRIRKPAKDDGERILVERLWPRGLTKDEAKLDLWLKDRVRR